MVKRIGDALDRVIMVALSLGFAALIVTVGLQVLSRNVIKIPLIWTLDLAQLLFTWLIFLGAAVAFRRRAHYIIDLLPPGATRASRVLDILSAVAAVVVVYVLTRYGLMMTEMRSRGEVASLGISEAWYYAALPVCGALIGVFLVERLILAIRPPS